MRGYIGVQFWMLQLYIKQSMLDCTIEEEVIYWKCTYYFQRHLILLSLYTGHLVLSGDMTFTPNKTNNSFTLTCISTGGPATTVTWTRDSTTVTEGTETVLDNGSLSQLSHTLLVTDRMAGLYMCKIANDVSYISAQLTVQGKASNCSFTEPFLSTPTTTVMNVKMVNC